MSANTEKQNEFKSLLDKENLRLMNLIKESVKLLDNNNENELESSIKLTMLIASILSNEIAIINSLLQLNNDRLITVRKKENETN